MTDSRGLQHELQVYAGAELAVLLRVLLGPRGLAGVLQLHRVQAAQVAVACCLLSGLDAQVRCASGERLRAHNSELDV